MITRMPDTAMRHQLPHSDQSWSFDNFPKLITI